MKYKESALKYKVSTLQHYAARVVILLSMLMGMKFTSAGNINIWDLAKSISNQADQIESVVSASPSSVSLTINYIHQIDIPYTITAAGVYYLAESVSFTPTTTTFESAITVNASNVDLDLQGHTISSAFDLASFPVAIRANPNFTNNAIHNGFFNTVVGIIIDQSSSAIGTLMIDRILAKCLICMGSFPLTTNNIHFTITRCICVGSAKAFSTLITFASAQQITIDDLYCATGVQGIGIDTPTAQNVTINNYFGYNFNSQACSIGTAAQASIKNSFAANIVVAFQIGSGIGDALIDNCIALHANGSSSVVNFDSPTTANNITCAGGNSGISGSDTSVTQKCVAVDFSAIGIENTFGSDGFFAANVAYQNATNYSNVNQPIVISPDAATKYWVNVEK